MRPLLKPALPHLWRDETTLQLGADPASAVVLAGFGAGARAVLDLLDGQRTSHEVVGAAIRAGVPADVANAVLDLLGDVGALDDATTPDPLADLAPRDRRRLRGELAATAVRSQRPGIGAAALRRRRQARVSVHGDARLGTLVASVLATAGVGRHDLRLSGQVEPTDVLPGGVGTADVGTSRIDAARAALARVTAVSPEGRVSRPHLVLLVGSTPDVAVPGNLVGDRVPHLSVAATALAGVVGPLVAGGGPCLRCLDLHRRDRDPAWPRLRSQRGDPPADAALAVATAGVAAAQALAFLDGTPVAVAGATLELRPPDWLLRRRSWSVHPECRCAERSTDRRSAGRLAGSTVRMEA